MSFERRLYFLWPPGGIGLEKANLTHSLMLFGFPLTIVIIPGSEDDKLLVVIDERPAPRPVPAGGPTTLDKLFSVHTVSLCSLIEKHFIGNLPSVVTVGSSELRQKNTVGGGVFLLTEQEITRRKRI